MSHSLSMLVLGQLRIPALWLLEEAILLIEIKRKEDLRKSPSVLVFCLHTVHGRVYQ